jgi:hypothetical protein
MSTIIDTDKIDLISLSNDKKKIRLIMIETRKWDSDPNMYKELKEKLDNYLTFVEEEQFLDMYPYYSKSKINITISVESIFEPSKDAKEVFENISKYLYELGYDFEFNLLKQ